MRHQNQTLTEREKLLQVVQATRAFLSCDLREVNYQKIASDMLQISQVQSVSFNILNEDGNTFRTVALAAPPGAPEKAATLLGYHLVGRSWPYLSSRRARVMRESIVLYDRLHDLTADFMPEAMATLLTQDFGLGSVAIVRVMTDHCLMGNFILFLARGEILNHLEAIEIYAGKVGLHLAYKNQEKVLLESEEKYRDLSHSLDQALSLLTKFTRQVPGAVYQYLMRPDGSSCFPMTSEGIWEIYEVRPDDVVHDAALVYDRIHPAYFDRVVATIQSSYRSLTIWEDRYRVILPERGLCWVHGVARPEKLDDGSVLWHGYLRDITDVWEKQRQIEYLSLHDHLTGLFNRRYMDEAMISLDVPDNLPLAILALDLNGLKQVNDTHGHDAGDRLIQRAADVIRSCCSPDDVIGRVGGDEFMILMPRTGQVLAEDLRQRIMAAATRSVKDGTALSLAAGWAVKTSEDQSIHQVRDQADAAMYLDKSQDCHALHHRVLESLLRQQPRDFGEGVVAGHPGRAAEPGHMTGCGHDGAASVPVPDDSQDDIAAEIGLLSDRIRQDLCRLVSLMQQSGLSGQR